MAVSRTDQELADRIVSDGILSKSEIDETLTQLARSRTNKSLGQHLYEQGKLEPGQMRRILSSMCECVMRCRACARKFGLKKYDPSKNYRCSACRGDLEVLPMGTAVGEKDNSKDPYLGRVIGHFKLEARLGRGGTATVYRARDQRLDRQVALKVLPKELTDPESNALARFVREARAIARVHHPGIVSVFDVGEVESVRYIAMEFVDGESLRSKVHREGKFAPRDAIRAIATVARALHTAHEAGVIHRDIKPENILVTRGGTVHVTDFGLAKLRNDRRNITLAGTAIGTPSYMSPEQCKGKKVDPRSDIYSLGLTMWFLLTGATPYDGTSLEIIQQHCEEKAVPSARTVIKDLDENICLVLDKMINKNLGARYQDALVLAEDLERLLIGEEPMLPGMFDFLEDPVEASHADSIEVVLSERDRARSVKKEREVRNLERRRWVWPAAALVAGAALLAFLVFHRSAAKEPAEGPVVQVQASPPVDTLSGEAARRLIYFEEQMGGLKSLRLLAEFYRELDQKRDLYDEPAWAQRVGKLRAETLVLIKERYVRVDEAARFLAETGKIEQARELYLSAVLLPVNEIRQKARSRLDALLEADGVEETDDNGRAPRTPVLSELLWGADGE